MIKTFIDKLLGKKPGSPAAKAKNRFGKRVDVPVSVHGIDPELVELAKKQGREFTDVDAHTLLTDALDSFRKEMDENGWEYGQDDEELFELAMHPEQYRN